MVVTRRRSIIVFVAVLSRMCLVSGLAQNGKIRPERIELGDLIGSGEFGRVHWGNYCSSQKEGNAPPERIVAKSAKPGVPLAAAYLETEAYVNRRLSLESNGRKCPYIAPYIGEYTTSEGTKQLVWAKSGDWTLDECLSGEKGLTQLADALDIGRGEESATSQHTLAREILRQILTALSYAHSIGIVHRDIKPGAFLVDEASHCLRLIDFGGACDLSSWLGRKGYRGRERGIRTLLYCPPEEFIEMEHPFAFDIYSAATTWLRLVVPGLRMSEDKFFNWRLAVRDKLHDIEEWQENTALSSLGEELPDGWEEFFSCAEGREAWRLIKTMLSYSPHQRPTATDALQGTYLNPDCSQDAGREPPPVPWSLASHLESAAMLSRPAEECILSDTFFASVYEIDVELSGSNEKNISFRDRPQGGVEVTDFEQKSGEIKAGDQLLEMGPIDVEEADTDHVLKILRFWPKPSIRLLFRRQ